MPAWTLGERDFAANGNNLPGGAGRDWARFDWAHDRAARAWRSGWRATRASRAPGKPASVQNDVVSLGAQRTSPLLVELASFAGGALSPRAKAALDTLRGWDFSMRRTRVAPTLNRSWWNCYLRRSGFEGYPGLALAALSGEAAGELKSPTGEPETPPQAALAALEMALDTLTAKLGPDMSAWKWGAAHHARFVHALSAQGAAARARFEPPYTPEDGDGSTPSVGGTRAPFSFDVRHGPCYRHVVGPGRLRHVTWRGAAVEQRTAPRPRPCATNGRATATCASPGLGSRERGGDRDGHAAKRGDCPA